MAKIKSYTDLEQSKKLAEILPIETADMYWYIAIKGNPKAMFNEGYNKYGDFELPCWSLAALLNVLHRVSLEKEKFFYNKSLYNCDYTYRVIANKYTDNNIFGRLESNPIDACYEMIIHLHKLNLL